MKKRNGEFGIWALVRGSEPFNKGYTFSKFHLLNPLLFLFCLSFALSADSFWQKTVWTTSDGVQLVGDYHPASNPKAFTWVLLHGLGSYRGEWNAFSQKLANQGDGVLIYDARGHFDSNKGPNGTILNYKEWQTGGPGTPWDAMPSDLGSAVQMLHKTKGIPENKIAVGGASVGANVALTYAADHASVPALILLSPGIQYTGIASEGPYVKYRGRPVFMAASPDDRYAYASVQQLASEGNSATQRVLDGPDGHGVNMLKDEFTKQLLDWIKKVEHH